MTCGIGPPFDEMLAVLDWDAFDATAIEMHDVKAVGCSRPAVPASCVQELQACAALVDGDIGYSQRKQCAEESVAANLDQPAHVELRPGQGLHAWAQVAQVTGGIA